MLRHMYAVTRIEIAVSLEDAFAAGTASGAYLAEYAANHGARQAVLQVLGRLHREDYHELRELWAELRDVPVEP